MTDQQKADMLSSLLKQTQKLGRSYITFTALTGSKFPYYASWLLGFIVECAIRDDDKGVDYLEKVVNFVADGIPEGKINGKDHQTDREKGSKETKPAHPNKGRDKR